MEVRQLQIFRVLAGELNFARTAEKVHTVQSNITAHEAMHLSRNGPGTSTGDCGGAGAAQAPIQGVALGRASTRHSDSHRLAQGQMDVSAMTAFRDLLQSKLAVTQ